MKSARLRTWILGVALLLVDRGALSRKVALAEKERCRHWWQEDVVDAFMQSVAVAARTAGRAAA